MSEELEALEEGKKQRPYRSVSQRNSINNCGMMYYLERRANVWQRPAAWTVQGLALHEAIEHYERTVFGQVKEDKDIRILEEAYIAAYKKHANRMLADAPNTKVWQNSGPHDGAKDLERRWDKGLEQCERYLKWSMTYPYDIQIVGDNEQALELRFDIDLDGVPVVGYIDQVRDLVIDAKSGKTPGDDFQLATYKIALKEQFGIEVKYGAYWMGETGKLTKAYDLSDWSRNKVADEYNRIDHLIKAEKFAPNPGKQCRMCSVNHACEFRSF